MNTAIAGCSICNSANDCEDSDVCTQDACVDNHCVYSSVPGCQFCSSVADCADLAPCTSSACTNNECVYTPVQGCGVCDLTKEDADGNVLAEESCNIHECIHNDSGETLAAMSLAPDASPMAMASGDVDGDADSDMVIANHGTANSLVLLNNGHGVFAPAVNYAFGVVLKSAPRRDLDGEQDRTLLKR